MDIKYINIDKINIGNVNIKDEYIVIPILYNNDELFIKIPENNNTFFKIDKLDHEVFNSYLMLEFMEDIDNFEDEYKNNLEILHNQKEAMNFTKFIINLKNKIIMLFFNKLEIDKEYLNMISFNELNLENYEIDKAIWDENIDFSYIPENILDNNDDSDEDIDISLKRRLHVNKITKKEKNFMLKCNIVFINKKLEDKKHIYINWNVV